MPEITSEQRQALQVAHDLADLGAPIFAAYPNSSSPGEFLYPTRWQDTPAGSPSHNWINRWRPGMCLAMVTGVIFDVLDIDPRNGGREGFAELAADLDWDNDGPGMGPLVYASAATPSAGEHHLIARTHLAKGKPARGVDLQAGDDHGEGRGFIFIAPTVRPSKHGPLQGQPVAYRWMTHPARTPDTTDPGLDRLVAHITAAKPGRRTITTRTTAAPAAAGHPDDDDLFDAARDAWTPTTANRAIGDQLAAVKAAQAGEINTKLGGAARMLGRFVAGGYLAEDHAAEMLLDALQAGGVHDDTWNLNNGKKWTAVSVIADGMAKGALEPWEVTTSTAPGAPQVTALPQPAASPRDEVTYPRLHIEPAATMAYWLQQEIGRGRLSGFFAQGGQVVHTPRMNELGYVPAGPGNTNGPAEIRPVTPDTLAAKLQYLYFCYKPHDIKGPDGKKTGESIEVPAMFPAAAAKVAVNAPEALGALRTLRGLTNTPMVRSDGTLLERPGYDPASGFLFLPAPGVNVPPVPDRPAPEDCAKAVALLLTMIEGFPFATDEDRANYLGMLLTPMLRELTPPSYKLFGISAHQPGSGKSLLADTISRIHGSVFRSEVPDDEYGWRQMTTSLLATTSAPVVIIDNVTGVLRSSVLAGLLTASGELQERELGKSSNLTFTNDRTWVITGNNMSLGGDLVRRTITIMIDPDMANPETRTNFRIKDLPRWVDQHRNDILWSLLVLIRAWDAAGRPAPARAQSDSFAAWQTAVGGILAHAGIPGGFDNESGKRAAGGGDDDGLAMLLQHLGRKFGAQSFGVAEALAPDGGEMVFDTRDWLPSVVLDKLARSEASGRKSFGHWLRNRIGRWVSTETGVLVLRSAGVERMGARWTVEQR